LAVGGRDCRCLAKHRRLCKCLPCPSLYYICYLLPHGNSLFHSLHASDAINSSSICNLRVLAVRGRDFRCSRKHRSWCKCLPRPSLYYLCCLLSHGNTLLHSLHASDAINSSSICNLRALAVGGHHFHSSGKHRSWCK